MIPTPAASWGLTAPLPMDRVHFVNPGETIALGNRTPTAVKPPVFDNPCTTGFYDGKAGVLFSSDCFGALLQEVPQNAADLSESDLRDGQIVWATIDSPWLHKVDKDAFGRELDGIRKIAPRLILSNHLPPAPGHLMERFLGSLMAAPGAHPFVGPNQAAFEQMLKQMAAPERVASWGEALVVSLEFAGATVAGRFERHLKTGSGGGF